MPSDRIRGFLLPLEPNMPTPVNALIFIEAATGNRVHVCASREQVRALLAACPETENVRREKLHNDLAQCYMPEASAHDAIVIDGWAGGYLVERLDGDQIISEETLGMYANDVLSMFHLILPDEDEEGDQAILMAMDAQAVFNVWILSSRVAVRDYLARVQDLVEPEHYEETLAWFAQEQKIPEEDPGRPPILFQGCAAAIVATINFCLDEQQRNAS